jgi:hypothetical protein
MTLKEVMCMCLWWTDFHTHLQMAKDPYDMINHKEIQIILARRYHKSRKDWNSYIQGAIKRNLITLMGRNQIGCFYKVN